MIFKKTLKENKKNNLKSSDIAVDFNLDILDHDKCGKVQNVFNFLYKNGMIPTTNKPTSVTKKNGYND